MRTAAQPESKLLHLDVLRGVAIFMVFWFHTYAWTFWRADLPWAGWFHDFSLKGAKSPVLFYPYTLGQLGVALFFVLSGYCIHLSFLSFARKRPAGYSLREFCRYFFVRRFFRIYPAYLAAVLFFLFVFFPKTYEGAAWWKQIVTHLSLTHNFWPDTYSEIAGAFWSLAYEWQLYCLYPFFLALRRQIGVDRTFVVVAVGSVLYSVLVDCWAADQFALKDAVFRSRYALPWFLGVFLCEKHSRGERLFPRCGGGLLLAYVGALAAAEFAPCRPRLWEISCWVFAWTIEWYSDRQQYSLPERGLAGLGVISYSFYLFHDPLVGFLGGLAKPLLSLGYPYNQLTLGGLVFIFGPLIGLSWLSYRLIEKPLHELGLRLTSGRSGSSPLPQPPR
jgi:peptidoglycan/LPS O-acetylase OafA/YrhL